MSCGIPAALLIFVRKILKIMNRISAISCDSSVRMSQKAVLGADKGEPVKGVAGAGAGIELWGLTH